MNSAPAPIKILSVARMRVTENRGTPIRVRNITSRLAENPKFLLAMATWDSSAPIPGVNWFPLKNNHREDIWAIVSFIRKERIDIVIGHTLSSWFLLCAVRLFTGAKIMLEMHGFPEEEAKLYGSISVPRYWMERIVFAITYLTVDLITACSETAAMRLRHYNRNTRTVYGGVDIAAFNRDVVPESRSVGKIRIGYVGNGRIWQGVPFLLETYERYFADDVSLELALLLSEQKGLSIPPGVVVHPPVPHELAPSFLASCDILVIPRPQNEVNRLSFPSKLIEYMAMGKPVVASKTSDAHKVITDGQDGLLYEPGDMKGLADAIRTLKNPAIRERVGAAASETVKDSYTWDHQVGLVESAISELFR